MTILLFFALNVPSNSPKQPPTGRYALTQGFALANANAPYYSPNKSSFSLRGHSPSKVFYPPPLTRHMGFVRQEPSPKRGAILRLFFLFFEDDYTNTPSPQPQNIRLLRFPLLPFVVYFSRVSRGSPAGRKQPKPTPKMYNY